MKMERLIVLLVLLPCVSATIIAESPTSSVEMFGTGLQTASASGPSLSATVLTTAFQPGAPNAVGSSVSANIGFFGDDSAASPSATQPAPSTTPSSPPSPTTQPTPGPSEPTGKTAITISCPEHVLIAPAKTNITVQAVDSSGALLCIDQIEVAAPKLEPAIVQKEKCENGVSTFKVEAKNNGNYTATAAKDGNKARCVFSSIGQPPRPADETNVALIVLVALGAFVFSRRN